MSRSDYVTARAPPMTQSAISAQIAVARRPGPSQQAVTKNVGLHLQYGSCAGLQRDRPSFSLLSKLQVCTDSWTAWMCTSVQNTKNDD